MNVRDLCQLLSATLHLGDVSRWAARLVRCDFLPRSGFEIDSIDILGGGNESGHRTQGNRRHGGPGNFDGLGTTPGDPWFYWNSRRIRDTFFAVTAGAGGGS